MVFLRFPSEMYGLPHEFALTCARERNWHAGGQYIDDASSDRKNASLCIVRSQWKLGSKCLWKSQHSTGGFIVNGMGLKAPCLPRVHFASSLVGGDIVETCYVWNAASTEFFSI